MFGEKHGLESANIPGGVSLRQLWHHLLLEGNVHGTTKAMVHDTVEQFPRNPRSDFLRSLLANQPTPPLGAEPVNPTDRPSPMFQGPNPAVTQPEALLFGDDLTLPVGKVAGVLRSIGRVMERASSICLLRVTSPVGGFFGTGFRIGPDFVLTNHHVLFPRGQKATKVRADFFFELDADDTPVTVQSLAGDVASIDAEPADDWGVLRVAGMAAAWPIISLTEAVAPSRGDAAYILQHPGGQMKRLGFVRNTISEVADRLVHYLTDTEPGSSE